MGLRRAYEADDGVFRSGGTLYIAGTRPWRLDGLRDVADDFALPIVGASHSNRYQQASLASSGVTRLVGHSLGAAVAQEMASRDRSLSGIAYGGPTSGSLRTVRGSYDPVGWLGGGTVLGFGHSYPGVVAADRAAFDRALE